MSICEHVQAHLNDFLDGTLGSSQAQELNAHLRECATCREEYRALKATQELLRALPVPDGKASRRRVLGRFRQAVLEEQMQCAPVPRWHLQKRPLMGMAVASCLALLCFSFYYLRPGPEPTSPGTPFVLETASCNQALPSARDLDEMTSLHAVQSFPISDGNEELQQDALADANSHLGINTPPAR
jgi:hypothetical protein